MAHPLSMVRLQIVHRSRFVLQCLHTVFREVGVTVLEQGEIDFAVFAQPEEQDAVDVVLIDLGLPQDRALGLIREVRDQQPKVRVVALVPLEHQNRVIEGVAAGVHGCVLEESSLEDLQRAIVGVANGETYCSEQIVRSLFHQVGRMARATRAPDRMDHLGLTRREQEILHLMTERLSNKEIAKKLRVSVFTVKNHVHNILEKLQVDSRVSAADLARDRSWIPD